MGPQSLFIQIRKNPWFLLQQYLREMLVFLVLIALLFTFPAARPSIINWAIPGLLLCAIVYGCALSSFLHNTSHGNIPNKLLNRIVGEWCGAWVSYGYTNFVMIHMLHHQFSDEELDPVNPKGMNFLLFLSAPMRYMIKTTKQYLFMVHQAIPHYAKIMQAQTVVFHINRILRVSFWYLLLGQDLFVWFYLPTLLTNFAIYAHINYVCHRDHADGSVEVVNLNHNLYYQIANRLTFGGYFHKNHHQKLSSFNPSLMNQDIWVPTPGTGVAHYFSLNDIWGERRKERLTLSQLYPKAAQRLQAHMSDILR